MGDGGSAIEKAAKLPFANYDIAVYFGVGICSLPFFSRYVLKTADSTNFPAIFSGYSDSLINSIVSIVSLTFGVYILGHGIALLSSLLVEQFLYRVAGTPSKIIVDSSLSGPHARNYFRKYIISHAKASYGLSAPSDIVRLIFHTPAMPVYAIMLLLRFHGFYESKISSFIVLRVQNG